MQLSDFDYELPAELIAQYPLAKRTASRLLDVIQNSTEKSKAIFHDRIFTEIEELLLPGDLLIFNDTKVIPARLLGQKESGGKVELLIERVIDDKTALTQIRSSKTPKPGQKIIIEHATLNPIEIEVLERAPNSKEGEISPFFIIAFPGDCLDLLFAYGELPLPPYISHTPDDTDGERYQTVIAKNPGAVAAPTAGLHFDQDLLARLKNKGVQIEYVTLHVGAGTFSPVRSEDLSQHQMHFERFTIPKATRDAIALAKESNRRVIAVGTTSLRALESSVIFGDKGDTNLFITPGYQFKVVDVLITNFHLPKSTLLMLVSAFAGYETIREAYRYAIAHQYRFFSYGDAMFLRRS
jgi:S-adenosylmethionine:tRNA ribosyltransferase-isomerase